MKKYFGILAVLVLVPAILQLLWVDNSSFKWAHYRWYLILSVLLSYVFSKLKYNKHFLVNFSLMYGIMGCSVAAVYKYAKNAKINGEFLWDELTITLAAIGVLYIVIYFVKYNRLNIPGLFSIIEIFMLMPYIANIAYGILEHDSVTANSLIAIYQTNYVEAMEFLKSTAPLYSYVIAAIVLLVLYILLYMSLKNLEITIEILSRKQIAVLIIILIGTVFLGNKTFKSAYFARISFESKEYLKSVEKYNAYRFTSDGELKYIEAKTNVAENETYLVVIGESQNRKHMSAYGYTRDTTPWLQEQLNNKNFLFMGNGYACNTLTMLALSQALTEKSQYNHKPLEQSYSLVDIAKAAGFKTYWISNQAQYGSFNTPITLIANSADEKIWLNSDSSASSSYDEKVIDSLKNIKSNEKKIIFIHLLGNHWEYQYRYPHENYNRYTNKSVDVKVADVTKLNEYDNSMYYNDFVVKDIFEYAKNNWNLSNMTYFSDHGEAVMSNNKHIPSKYEDDMGTIPVYFYFSDNYMAKNLDLVRNAQKNKQLYFTNDMMYNALLDIWGIKTPYYNFKEDFLSKDYGYTKDDLLILDKIKI